MDVRQVMAVVGAVFVAACAWAHPKPGAHADIRYTIDDQAVHAEVLMNLRFAEQLVRWDRASRDDVAQGEEAAGQEALLEYFGGPVAAGRPWSLDRRNRVVVDGVEVAPVLVEYRIVRPKAETRPGFVDVSQAMLPQVLVRVDYPCKAGPRAVSLVWGMYPRNYLAQDRDIAPVSDLEAVIMGQGDVAQVLFKEQEPEYTWHAPALGLDARFRPVPSVGASTPGLPVRRAAPWGMLAAGLGGGVVLVVRSPGRRGMALGGVLACLGVALAVVISQIGARPSEGLPTEKEAMAIFEPLHANIYRAFDYTREQEVYDALARSVEGPMLARVYDDIYRSLIMHEEGGALSRVKSVTSLANRTESVGVDPETGRPRIEIDARWRVEGVVYHWGHSHTRVNEYRARYRVEAGVSGWRIVGVEPLEQRRVDTVGRSPGMDEAGPA